MAVSETGRLLAELKAQTGLSWAALADTIGASSGDYVRKVASGAKPGRNLAGNVSRLWQTGRVEAPVPRRRTASGAIARVRASRDVGAPSRRPAETALRAPYGSREVFRTARGRLGWSTRAAAGDDGAVRDAIRSAGRGQRRVSVRVQVRGRDGRKRMVTVGAKGGYRPRDLQRAIADAGGVRPWAMGTLAGRHYGAPATEDDVLDVEVIAE